MIAQQRRAPSLAAMAGARGQSHGLIDNFFLTDEELENSPSRRAGVDAETEHRLRVFGCELIQLGVLHMRAPQAVAATGQVLLQRFYCKESLMKYDVKVCFDVRCLLATCGREIVWLHLCAWEQTTEHLEQNAKMSAVP